ncbi:MAG: hypothetical protein H6621_07065 [Halobacteriovoraceae bacterium]|nr:hypothetical protein [Halobacteriovoraceae bacterium]
MKYLMISALLAIQFVTTSCSKKALPTEEILGTTGLGSDSGLGNPNDKVCREHPEYCGGSELPPPPEDEPEEEPGNKGNGTASGAGQAPGCTGVPGEICLGGYDSDKTPEDFPVKVVYGNLGGNAPADIETYTKNFIEKVNKNFVYKGHRYINLKYYMAVEDNDGQSDRQLITEHAEAGVLTMILVANLPGATAGYVQNSCAEIEKGQAWTVFQFRNVNDGVIEHESMHLNCFPHTSSQNGGTPVFFLSGYNTMEAVLRNKGSFKQPFDPEFKIYVDA